MNDDEKKMLNFLSARGIKTLGDLSDFYYESLRYPHDMNGNVIKPGSYVDCMPHGNQVTQRHCEVVAITSTSFVYYDDDGYLQQAARPDMFWRLHVTEKFDDLVSELFDRARECNDFNGNDERIKAEFVARFEIAAGDGGWEG